MKSRILSIALAAALCVGMGNPAFAADHKGPELTEKKDAVIVPNPDGQFHLIQIQDEHGITLAVGHIAGDVSEIEIPLGTDISGKTLTVVISDVSEDGKHMIQKIPDAANAPAESPLPTNPATPSGGGSPESRDEQTNDGSGNPDPAEPVKRANSQPSPPQEAAPAPGGTASNAGEPMVFFDIAETDWCYSAVSYVVQNGMMVGSHQSFMPHDKLTRGMMAQILYNMENLPAVGDAHFPDITPADWFASASFWANANGFMSGYANGLFGPNDPITREQLAAILHRYSGAKGYDTAASAELAGFADGSTVSDWAVVSMRWAVASGLLSGKDGRRLDPAGAATRAEIAQVLMNFGTKIAQ